MIVLGLVLVILGALIGPPILETIGLVLLLAGVVFGLLGGLGRPVGGRRWWY